MFVSSYNTYINTNNAQKSDKSRSENTQHNSKNFNSQLKNTTTKQSLLSPSTQIDYISKAQTQQNKELLKSQQEHLQKNDNDTFKKATLATQKFSATQTLNSAKSAYNENSFMFSFLRKPQATISQTPTISNSMPNQLQDAVEKNVRHTMINTYLENDSYYRVTA